MAHMDPMQRELQKANRRIKTLTKYLGQGSERVIYKETTWRMIETLYDKSSYLTNVTSGNLRIGGLSAEDRAEFLNILKRFNSSPLTTLSGQKKLMLENKRKFEETYGQTDENKNVIPMDEEDYKNLTSILESDDFKMFGEKYGTYKNVIGEMAATPVDYGKAMDLLSEVRRTPAKFEHDDGSLNVKAFINAWKQAGEGSV